MKPEPQSLKTGRFRPYLSALVSHWLVSKTSFQKIDYFNLNLLLALGVLIRLYKIPNPKKVVFDEVHFGGFAKLYYEGKFFIDVHPPLAKLVYYWISLMMGWNGKFDFGEIGDPYDENVPYIAMRLFSGACGILTVLLTYGILRATACRSAVAFFGSCLVLIENSFVTQSRLILLDSPLLCSIALAVFGIKKMQTTPPFSKSWFKYLLVTGFGLGFSCSIKLVGLFTLGWVGIVATVQLWKLAGDQEVSDFNWIKQLFFRLFGFVLFPATLYLGIFAVHFISLQYNGPGSGAVSPLFQVSFRDSQEILSMPVQVAYGSTVTIKSNNLESYLHSHDHPYNSGSGEQQVTLYDFSPDENNEWLIEPVQMKSEEKLFERVRPVKDGDVIRLYHKATGKYLHVNDVRPPISEHDYSNEVSCNGDRNLLKDINYEFKVRIATSKPHGFMGLPLIKLRATESVFQLIHQGTKCILLGHNVVLPKWGFCQKEVICVDEPTIPNSLWYIERNSHPLLDNDSSSKKVNLNSYSFLQKIAEYHRAMIRTNSGFVGDHPYSSTPEVWPFVLRGINFFSNEAGSKLTDEEGSHIYLLGNVAIYYSSILFLLIISMKFVFRTISSLNPFTFYREEQEFANFLDNATEFALGWFINYTPFFFMKRELYIHHYLPALFFAILASAQVVEHEISKRASFGWLLMCVMLMLSIYCFVHFSPIIYGTDWTRADCNHAKWLSSWDFNCLSYNR